MRTSLFCALALCAIGCGDPEPFGEVRTITGETIALNYGIGFHETELDRDGVVFANYEIDCDVEDLEGSADEIGDALLLLVAMGDGAFGALGVNDGVTLFGRRELVFGELSLQIVGDEASGHARVLFQADEEAPVETRGEFDFAVPYCGDKRLPRLGEP